MPQCLAKPNSRTNLGCGACPLPTVAHLKLQQAPSVMYHIFELSKIQRGPTTAAYTTAFCNATTYLGSSRRMWQPSVTTVRRFILPFDVRSLCPAFHRAGLDPDVQDPTRTCHHCLCYGILQPRCIPRIVSVDTTTHGDNGTFFSFKSNIRLLC